MLFLKKQNKTKLGSIPADSDLFVSRHKGSDLRVRPVLGSPWKDGRRLFGMVSIAPLIQNKGPRAASIRG